MNVLRHWLIGGHDTSERQPTVITDPVLAERWASRGEEILGPFVLEAEPRGAVADRDALAAYVAWRWTPVGNAPITLDDLRMLMARLGHTLPGGQ
jgi:hypothetical protein